MNYPWMTQRFTHEPAHPWSCRLQVVAGGFQAPVDVEELYQAFKERLLAELRVDVTHSHSALTTLVEVELEVET
jgi:hypothetical protein